MAYKQLPIIEVELDRLHLDLQNYRIPVAPEDEDAALNFLFASEDVLDQIKLFLRDGYFDNEVPIVVEEGQRYVVLEGNRRVSALKAIAAPEIVPDHLAQVEELRIRYATEVSNMPGVIRVIVVPTREAALKQIARLHTRTSKRKWSRDQQANYYYSFLGPGVTAEDLKALYPDIDIIRFLRMVAVRKFLSGVKFKDKGLHEYAISSNLTMSSFEYAYRNAAIAGAVGIRFNSDGRIKPHTRKPENIGASLPAATRDGLEYLLSGFRSGEFNTRSSQFKAKSDEQVALIERLVGGATSPELDADDDGGPTEDGEEPMADGRSDSKADGGTRGDGRGTGAGSNGDADGSPPDPASGVGDEGGRGRGPNHPDTLRGIRVEGLPFEHVPSNLLKRVLELRAINVSKTPAATAMLLRSVLEATIKWHFSGTPTPISGMLSEVIPNVATMYGKERAFKDNINVMKSGSTTQPGSVHWFNAASHNPNMEVKADDVRSAYSMVEPVLIRLMRPPV